MMRAPSEPSNAVLGDLAGRISRCPEGCPGAHTYPPTSAAIARSPLKIILVGIAVSQRGAVIFNLIGVDFERPSSPNESHE
jgi:hypothetical protein